MLSLLRTGAFDEFGAARTEQFWEMRAMGIRPAGPELDLASAPVPAPSARTEPERLQRLRDEMELLGFPVGGHPVELFPSVAWESYAPLAAVRDFAGSRVTVCGLVVAERLHRQKDGRVMKFITICDRTDFLECELFAAAYRAGGGVLARCPVVALTGQVEPLGSGPGCVLRVAQVQPARTVTTPGVRPAASRKAGTSARPDG
jgi:DNA polymerase III alpha subunit